MASSTGNGSDSSTQKTAVAVPFNSNSNTDDVYKLVFANKEVVLDMTTLMNAMQDVRNNVTVVLKDTYDPDKRNALIDCGQTLNGMMDKGKNGQQIFDPHNLDHNAVVLVLNKAMDGVTPSTALGTASGTEQQQSSSTQDFSPSKLRAAFINAARVDNTPPLINAGPYHNDINKGMVNSDITKASGGPPTTVVNVTGTFGKVTANGGLNENHADASMLYRDDIVSAGFNRTDGKITKQMAVDYGGIHAFANQAGKENIVGAELVRDYHGTETRIGVVCIPSGKPKFTLEVTTPDDTRFNVSTQQTDKGPQVNVGVRHSF